MVEEVKVGSSPARWYVRWPEALVRDLRFGLRIIAGHRWTSAAIVLSVAIGVGANTAVTSVLDAVLLNPLGIQGADRIVTASVHLKKLQMDDAETSGAEFRDIQSMPETFSAVTATEPRAWTLLRAAQPERLTGVAVTPQFFQVFNGKLALGNYLHGSNRNEIILSYRLWQTLFGGSQSALGTKLLIDGEAFQVVGVAGPEFHFPANAQAWTPLLLTPDRFKRGNDMSLSLYGRLRAGVSQERAQARLDRFIGNLMSSPQALDLKKLQYGLDLRPLAQHVSGSLRQPLLLLWSAASILLLAACANVAGLLLSRAGSRRKEMAIRISIGASGPQILRQLLAENIILSLAGGCAGLLAAALGIALLRRQPLPYQNTLALVRLDVRMLVYGMALALACSLLFGLVPAWELLRSGHAGALARSRRKWFQNIYIVGQVGAAMSLAVLTGLLLKSLDAIQSLRPGFDPHQVTSAFIIKPPANQPAFYQNVLAGLRSSPGVESAALGYSVPFGGDSPTSLFDIKGHQHLAGEPEWHAEAYQISADYFTTLRIPLLRGRPILASDTAGSAPVCVIDANLAKRFFANQNPIGQQIRMYSPAARIVGVVASIRDNTLEHASRPVVYYPLAQVPYFPQLGIVVRSAVPAASLIRTAVSRANPNVPVFNVKTMDELINASFASRSLIAWLVAIFSSVSMLLAGLGIHALIAQVVFERTGEIGIRMALGARATGIFQHYLLQGLRLSLAGILIGLSAAVFCRQWLQAILFEVQPLDPSALIIAGAGVLLISALAVLAPSWRASRIDPQIALRAE